jgi:hypothetical protein
MEHVGSGQGDGFGSEKSYSVTGDDLRELGFLPPKTPDFVNNPSASAESAQFTADELRDIGPEWEFMENMVVPNPMSMDPDSMGDRDRVARLEELRGNYGPQNIVYKNRAFSDKGEPLPGMMGIYLRRDAGNRPD